MSSFNCSRSYLDEKKQQLCNKLSNMHLSKKEREQLKLEIDNYDYILNLVEMLKIKSG
ncbi:DUF3896 family protein [Bacillus sp. D-CC]